MYIKDLIRDLHALYEYEMEHYDVMGEPVIMIDIFGFNEDKTGFVYKGFDKDIRITRSTDGVYPILTAFEKGTD